MYIVLNVNKIMLAIYLTRKDQALQEFRLFLPSPENSQTLGAFGIRNVGLWFVSVRIMGGFSPIHFKYSIMIVIPDNTD